ncbi:hypothetical protein IAU60_000997 [Kwoniella sp. DSM 27419]
MSTFASPPLSPARQPQPVADPSTPPQLSSQVQVKVTLPTPPSFLAHRSRSSESVPVHGGTLGESTPFGDPINEDLATIEAAAKAQGHSKRSSMSFSSAVDHRGDKKDRRVSFSLAEATTTGEQTEGEPSEGDVAQEGPGRTPEQALKSPVYKIPQRQRNNDGDKAGKPAVDPVEIDLSEIPTTPPSKSRSSLVFKGSPNGPSASPSRLTSTAAAKGISIAPSLSRGGAFRSIWSAGIVPSTTSGWISPATLGAPAPASAKLPSSVTVSSRDSRLISLDSPASPLVGMKSPAAASAGSAVNLAKQRGLSIAILKEDGRGVLPLTPGLSTGSGLKSPIGGGLKSSEMKLVRGVDIPGGLSSAKTTGVPETPESATSRKEIILCKFYHTPGQTCTSRPCRFVHSLSSVSLSGPATSPSPGHNSSAPGTGRLLTPSPLSEATALKHSPDPTSGTFAHAQMSLPSVPSKRLQLRADTLDLGDVQPGERVIVEDEDGTEVIGTVFFMSGGGKGAMGKSREKWKTVPCKDYAEGHCPYGDYCSFIHDEKLPAGLLTEDHKSQNGDGSPSAPPPTPFKASHRRSASVNSSLALWAKRLHQVQLVPDVAVDPDVLSKTADLGLSAFAPPFSKQPLAVDPTGEVVPAAIVTPPPGLLPPDAIDDAEPSPVPTTAAAPARSRLTVWSKGPPPSLRKVASVNKVAASDSPSLGDDRVAPPVSAVSTHDTESDPATPFDPLVHRRKLAELESTLVGGARQPTRLSLFQNADSVETATTTLPVTIPAPLPPTTYPWGMPMSPITPPNYQDPSIPNIPGGLGVIWTPAGWAVQDAAMKNALRSAEVLAKYGSEAKTRRHAKNYFRTRLCKFFAQGYCPHGQECTYLHVMTPPSPDQTASSDSDSVASSPPQPHTALSRTLDAPARHPKFQTLPCKFYNSALGCANGSSCNFMHTRVVPDSAPLVERPRPWRTKPCRHFQLGRCTLADACHFAHVIDPAWLASGPAAVPVRVVKDHKLCEAWSRTGRCADGEECRHVHAGEGGEGNAAGLTEEGLERTLEEARAKRWDEVDEEDDDDVEIVTGLSSSTYSPSSSSFRA